MIDDTLLHRLAVPIAIIISASPVSAQGSDGPARSVAPGDTVRLHEDSTVLVRGILLRRDSTGLVVVDRSSRDTVHIAIYEITRAEVQRGSHRSGWSSVRRGAAVGALIARCSASSLVAGATRSRVSPSPAPASSPWLRRHRDRRGNHRLVHAHRDLAALRSRRDSWYFQPAGDDRVLGHLDLDLIVVEHRTVPEIRLSLRRGLIRVRAVPGELAPPDATAPTPRPRGSLGSTRAIAANAPRSLCTVTRIPAAIAATLGVRRDAAAPPARCAWRRSEVMFTNVELRNVCAGDEMSVSG